MLTFAVPHVRIQGSPDIHVDQGSVINLTCIISSTPEPPVYVFWYHGDQVRKGTCSQIVSLVPRCIFPSALRYKRIAPALRATFADMVLFLKRISQIFFLKSPTNHKKITVLEKIAFAFSKFGIFPLYLRWFRMTQQEVALRSWQAKAARRRATLW